jgi:DNA repair protein RecN (Recombination protein N)
MLVELRVRDLGVIDDLQLLVGPGMTAITGETGAGKTLLVEAIELLVGGRADPARVRAGAAEASIEGRFETHEGDVVLARSVPTAGRSRAYIDGRMAPVAQLADTGGVLVDLHGQHAHQSLLASGVQRAALDLFGSIDLAPRRDAAARVHALDAELAALGGDVHSRAREIDLLRFQVDELDAAGITDPAEDDDLALEEERLADAAAHRDAAGAAWAALADEGGAADAVGQALTELTGRAAFGTVADRVHTLAADIADVAADLRAAGESIVEDPERLALVQARRQLLTALRRKYGDSLADVIAFSADVRERLAALESYESRAAALEDERAGAAADLARVEAEIGEARRRHAPALAAAVAAQLPDLALGGATFDVEIDDSAAGDGVSFLLSANPGEPARPLAKVASGGELARCMLALRLVLRDRTVPTLIFDEVDAGIGGQAAVAVGRALATLAADHQVLVVTHLPQVAAFADNHVAVAKDAGTGRSIVRAAVLDDAERVGELTRMLSGLPDSETGRDHAHELLTTARRERAR